MNTKLSKWFTYHLIDRKSWPQINNNLIEFERTQWLPIEKLEEFQWLRMKKLLMHSYQNVPYYKKKFNEIGIQPQEIKNPEDLSNVPVLKKSDLRENLPALIADNYCNRLIQNRTGGSTGEPTIYYQDNQFFNIQDAIIYRINKWLGVEIGDRLAMIWGTDFNEPLISKPRTIVKRFLTNTLLLSAFELNEQKMMTYAQKIKHFKPKVIIGYVSCLYTMAQFMIANKIEITFPCKIISSAEVLHDFQKDVIQRAFKAEVFNRYGTREVGCIAQECDKHSGLHINAEHVYVEYIHRGKSVKNPNWGTLAITSLSNYAMPFIRYEIGDIGIPGKNSCSCGRNLPLMEQLKGRIHDSIVCSNGNFLPGEFFPHLFKEYDWIRNFQVIQKDRNNLEIKIQNCGRINREDLRYFQQKIQDVVGKEMQVTYDFVNNINKTKSGKLRVTISNVPISFT